MNGKVLYELWALALLGQGCDTDNWDGLEDADRRAWSELATSLNRVKGGLPTCTCGSPGTLDTVHRATAPCYAAPTDEEAEERDIEVVRLKHELQGRDKVIDVQGAAILELKRSIEVQRTSLTKIADSVVDISDTVRTLLKLTK